MIVVKEFGRERFAALLPIAGRREGMCFAIVFPFRLIVHREEGKHMAAVAAWLK